MELEGFYINLKTRTDRMNSFECLKKKYPFFKAIKRIDAIYSNYGPLGCSLSHVKCLNKLQNMFKNSKYVGIFEDDFEIINDTNYKSFLKNFKNIENKDWDLLTFTPLGIKSEIITDFDNYNFKRIYDTRTTTGYIIKREFITILLKQILYGAKILKYNKLNNASIRLLSSYKCDQIWKLLQSEYKFIYYKNIFAGQLSGYSNIEKRDINYNKKFLKQK